MSDAALSGNPAPAANDEILSAKSQFLFQAHTLNRRWFNLSLFVYRHFDAHFISLYQSGSHWVKNMLSHVLIERYGLPPMKHIQDDSVIGHPKSPPIYKNIPQIVHSHGCPHAFTLALPGVHFPKYLVLVRDLRESLISNYERFKAEYGGADFSTFLRGDLSRKRFPGDIYTRIRFLNEWGRLLEKHPERTKLVRYEDFRKDTRGQLRAACDFLGLDGITDAILDKAIEASTAERMASKPNPAVTTTVVRTKHALPFEEYFTPDNQAVFDAITGRYLDYDFGYGFKTRKSVTGRT